MLRWRELYSSDMVHLRGKKGSLLLSELFIRSRSVLSGTHPVIEAENLRVSAEHQSNDQVHDECDQKNAEQETEHGLNS